MDRDYGKEIDSLQKELGQVKELLKELVKKNETPQPKAQLSGEEGTGSKGEREGALQHPNKVEIIRDMHPNHQLADQMEELCKLADGRGLNGLINYMGVFSSGGRQSNWIRHQVDVAGLLALIENHTAQKVLACIGNGDRLNILLAILKKPRTVAELVAECNLHSTGQAYHHMKPLLTADLIVEDTASGAGKGVYIVQPHKVQGIVMLLAGIADMVDETYTKGCWEAYTADHQDLQ
ncbi:MAG: helix-turn-helix domain-containing protein [Lachnospiraceae bacterium]|nr:helix-turn-helix domain-containing protein [Lachnospiraceae bacterium]